MSEPAAVQIQRLRDSIKRKYRTFKTGQLESEELLEKQFKPIIEPLKEIVKQPLLVKKEKQEEEDEEGGRGEYSTPVRTPLPSPSLRNITSYRNSPASTIIERMSDKNPTKLYLQLLVTDSTNQMDHTYGVYLKDDKWMIGHREVRFVNKNLLIASQVYKLTPGLYELIFKKKPTNYDPSDSLVYKKILQQTSAHFQGYDPNRQVNSNKGYKYMNIIKPLMAAKTVSGTGMTLTNNAIDYIHWDDPNELVDRLRLLLASQKAGNLGHKNEIYSIIEELREGGIIKGGDMKGAFSL